MAWARFISSRTMLRQRSWSCPLEQWERLLQSLREEFLLREKELQLLHDIDLRISRKDPLDITLAFITNKTRELVHATHTSILLKRSSDLETVYASGPDKGQLVPISRSISGRCLTERRAINIPDLTLPDYRDSYIPIEGWTDNPMCSLLAVPIILDDSPIGVLNNESADPHAFNPRYERLAAAIAAQVGITLEHAQLFDQEKLFASVDRLIFADDKAQPVLQIALEEILDKLLSLKYVRLSGAQILLLSDDPDQLQVRHSTNLHDIGITVSVDDSVCGRAITRL